MELEKYLKRYSSLKSKRLPYESRWRELAEYLLPNKIKYRESGYSNSLSRRKNDRQHLYDSTPEFALDLFASSLVGFLANPAIKWFSLRSADRELMEDKEVAEWYEKASEVLLDAFNDEKAAFYTNLKACATDLGALGNTAIIVMPGKESLLSFKALDIIDIFVDVDYNGMVECVYWPVKMTVRQAANRYSADKLSDNTRRLLEQKPDTEITILQVIEPREKFDPRKLDKLNQPIKALHIEEKSKHLIEETGYSSNPIAVGRWDVMSDCLYGDGPADTALPDIKMLHIMQRALIMAAEKTLNPPLQGPADGFLGQIDISAGAYNANQGQGEIKPIVTVGNISITFDMVNNLQRSIQRTFYNDQLQMVSDANMTATEVLQRTEERLRLMAPMIGRVNTELLGPMISRAFNVVLEAGALPPLPEQLGGTSVRTIYVSPLQRSQRASESLAILNFAAQVGQIAQFKPETLNRINADEIIKKLHEISDLPEDILHDDETYGMLVEGQQQRQQQADALQTAEMAADAAAKASQAGIV